ncbi:unnamed protein product [Brachionus calyciflorus]|uniref:Uncharacterized protein n=1 Tax=Brachionus calyciflorus TaxID=104777 RepID=A0A813SHQ6_9BILA|nr:unnamed protein product [Brachionus calyciflorus]
MDDFSGKRGNKLYQIELGLQNEQSKIKVKKNLYEILVDLGINDETDLAMVSYCTDKPDRVLKLILAFRTKETSEKFKDYLEIDENLEQYNIKSINMSETQDNNPNNLRRLSTSSTDSYQIIPEDKSFNSPVSINVETSFYERPSSAMSRSSTNTFNQTMTESTLEEELKILDNETEIKNHFVEFFSDLTIEDSDLEMILLYLENSRKSGGGEYEEFKLDPTRRLLSVKYTYFLTKLRVLRKRSIKIKVNSKEFNLMANEPLDIESAPLENSVIIIKNIEDSWIRNEVVNIYAENLVMNDDDTNDVENIYQSKIFSNTVYVKYKHDFEPDKLKYRYEKRPSLNNVKIEIVPAFKTRLAMVKMFDINGTRISKDLIEMYFSNKKRCGAESYTSIHEREPYLLLSYDNQESCELVCMRKHELSKGSLIVEPLYNYRMLADELKNLEVKSDASKLEEKSDDVSKIDVKKEALLHEEKPQETRSVLRTLPSVKFSPHNVPLIKLFKYFGDTFLKEFETQLTDRQASLKITDSNDIVCECTHDLPDNEIEFNQLKLKWEADMNAFVQNYLKQFSFKEITIRNPDKTLSKINFDDLKVKIIPINQPNLFEFIGYSETVNKVILEIEREDELIKQEEEKLIDDTYDVNELYQIRILFVNKFIKQMKDKYPNMHALINPKKLMVSLRGTSAQIRDAKNLASDIISRIKHRDVPMEAMKAHFFENKEGDVVNWLREKSIQAALMPNIDKELVRIHSTDESELNKCYNLMREDVSLKNIGRELLEGVSEEEIQNFIRNHRNDEGVSINSKDGIIYICGFTNKVDNLFRKFFADLTNN